MTTIWVLYLYVCVTGICEWEPTLNKFNSHQECIDFSQRFEFLEIAVDKKDCRKTIKPEVKKIYWDLVWSQ